MIFNASCLDADLSKYDVIFADPPFEIWKDISEYFKKFDLSKKRIVCITNFQNREYITNVLGTPRIEMIWHFSNGAWVSHNMPQLCHENILIYGGTNEFYIGEENTYRESFKKSSIGRWTNGEKIKVKNRDKLQIQSVIYCPKNKKDGYGKPSKLMRPIVEAVCFNKCKVIDMFGGQGGILKVLLDYDIDADSFEIDQKSFEKLELIYNSSRLFKKPLAEKGKIKDHGENVNKLL